MTPEEEKVIEAARAWKTANLTKYGALRYEAFELPLLKAIEALDASRAPKKPMSAEERWEQAITNSFAEARATSGGWSRPGITLAQFMAAESASWDRAVEAALKAINSVYGPMYGPDWKGVDALMGRCHTETP